MVTHEQTTHINPQYMLPGRVPKPGQKQVKYLYPVRDELVRDVCAKPQTAVQEEIINNITYYETTQQSQEYWTMWTLCRRVDDMLRAEIDDN